MSQRMDVLMKYTIYSRLIEHLSQQDTDLAPYLEKIMSENHKLPWLAMAYKSETLSDAEREVASGYLSLGFFKNLWAADCSNFLLSRSPFSRKISTSMPSFLATLIS